MCLKNNALKLLILLCSLAYLSSCNKEEGRAKDSMIGLWYVDEINSFYGFEPSEIIRESGELGSFTFAEDSVEYEFIRNDTLYRGNTIWDLDAEKQRSGFFRETVFTLAIGEEFLFEVTFEDGTRSSEKNAQEATFTNESSIGGNEVLLEFQLTKQ